MSALSRPFAPRHEAPVREADAWRERLTRWRDLPEPDLRAVPEAARFVVVDVEPTGLDPRVDRLAAIGAVVVERRRIRLGQSFYATLGASTLSAGPDDRATGAANEANEACGDPSRALLAFLEFAGKAPLVTYHAAFVEAMIRKAMAEHLGERFRPAWLDLAELAPDLLGGDGPRGNDLDGWLERFGIEVFRRHDAACDAAASGQLLLVVLARMRAARRRVDQMLWDRGAGRWLGRHPLPSAAAATHASSLALRRHDHGTLACLGSAR